MTSDAFVIGRHLRCMKIRRRNPVQFFQDSPGEAESALSTGPNGRKIDKGVGSDFNSQ